jgi:predicted amidophosphoribosyltransferase
MVAGMDPLILYAVLAVLGLALFGVISKVYTGHTRRCPGCDADVDFHARGCRHCGYRFGRT